MWKAKTPKGKGDAGGDVVAMKPSPIGTAARLAGIPPETLRIWERRYKMLAPGRTEGGHRLYSEHDVEVLRAVKRLVDSDMRIGTVAALPQERILEEAAKLAPPPAPAAPLLEGNDALLAEILDASRDLDTNRVSALLDRPRLLTDGLDVVTSLYLPLLHRVGELWHKGEISVAVEHFVEKLVTARIHAILQSTAGATSGRLALFACPSGERHEAGLLAAAVALKAAGFPVAILGADLPSKDLAEAAAKLAPAVVVLAVSSDLSVEARTSLPVVLERAPLKDVPLVLGGAQAAQLAKLLKREHTVVDAVGDVVATARRLAR
jgi:DNA-binding transcriptional MerR regulator/methylmalonyl-CoA mutase cobalamin-binding subunit